MAAAFQNIAAITVTGLLATALAVGTVQLLQRALPQTRTPDMGSIWLVVGALVFTDTLLLSFMLTDWLGLTQTASLDSWVLTLAIVATLGACLVAAVTWISSVHRRRSLEQPEAPSNASAGRGE